MRKDCKLNGFPMFFSSLVGKQGIETTSLLEVIEFEPLSCYCGLQS
nr:MAG TPA: hypothetical protein [Caudoviricetes sp.]